MNLDRVAFAWGVGPYGWGVVGINFRKYWPGRAIGIELAPRLEDAPLFVGLGNDLRAITVLRGTPTVAFPVFEDVEQVRASIDRLREYPIVITASWWNHDVLAEFGIKSRMVHQGYDPELFHPGIRPQPTPAPRFNVFSGGKAEYRKGQDLVLEGFKIFAQKHDDAVLHAAWASPWPELARTFERVPLGAPPGASIGLPNFSAWAQEAGLERHQFEIVPLTPNHLMPAVLARMDCAVFASRVEGGTNIAAMECLGCGIPTILSWTTGHRDLPEPMTAIYIDEPLDIPGQIAAALEGAYRGELSAPDRDAVDHFAWPARIAELVEVLKDV